MAWRVHENLIDGEIDNSTPGRVTGTLRFVGIDGEVTLELEGDFKGELRGRRIRLENPEPKERLESIRTSRRAGSYMDGFDRAQRGCGCEATVICSAVTDGDWLHVSWYSRANGRVVIELPDAAWRVVEEGE